MSFKVVQTIAGLEQLLPALGDSVLVQGYLKPEDGGGGIFFWDGASTEAPDRGTIISPLPMPAAGRWKRMWSGALDVRWFGAQGDWDEAKETGTDDYDALQAAAAAVNARRAGTLVFPPGTYRINRYRITGGPQLNDVKDIVYQNCTGLHILGYGAKIDVKGDFHRSADYQAGEDWYSYSETVQPFVFRGCVNFRVEGLELYGNVDKMTRDALVVESPGSGLWTGNTCRQYTLLDLYVHHFETDGLSLGTDEPIADRDAVLLNVSSLYNARNALSIVNLRGATFIRCEFSQSGRAAGKYLSHSPGAGLDIEPEVKADVPTGDFTFIECRFVNNTGMGFDTSSGIVGKFCESVFKRCLFWGTGSYSMLANAPKLVFEDCDIYGECLNWFASAIPDEPPRYIRCHFEDKEYPDTNNVFREVSCIATSGGNVQLEDCVVIANKTRGVWLDAAATKHILRTTTIIHKSDDLPAPSYVQSLLADCVFDRVHFSEDIQNPQGKSWILDVSPPEITDQIVVDGPYVLWADQSSGMKLNGNALGNTRPFPRVSLELNHGMNQLGPYQGYTTVGALPPTVLPSGKLAPSDGAPTSGSWKTGDLVLNQAPAAGGKVGWVCVAAGSPGTWRAFGQIDP